MARASKKAAPVQAEENVAPQEEVSEEASAPLEPVQLTIADLGLISRIIDLASRRGAFQAAELSQVGEAFNKLSGFLAYVESVQSEEAEAESTAEPLPAE